MMANIKQYITNYLSLFVYFKLYFIHLNDKKNSPPEQKKKH